MSKISPLAKRALGFNRHAGPNSSQVTSGRRMFVELGDARSAWAKRWADLIRAHVSDLGGPEIISEAQLSICRRASAMECELEAFEVAKPPDALSELAKGFEGFPPRDPDDDDDEPDEDEPPAPEEGEPGKA